MRDPMPMVGASAYASRFSRVNLFYRSNDEKALTPALRQGYRQLDVPGWSPAAGLLGAADTRPYEPYLGHHGHMGVGP